MPVDYLSLKPQIVKMGKMAAIREKEVAAKLGVCRTLLGKYSDQIILLQKTVEEAASKNKGLRCAVPVSESLATHIASNDKAPACTILSADGSQINPDPHGEVLFGLVNVGVFRLLTKSGAAPEIKTFTDLLYDEGLSESDGSLSEDLIALLRDVKEREILAKLASSESAPVITLTDGPLELYHEPRQDPQFERVFSRYLAALDELALNDVITAGYVDRPRADLVVRLLEVLEPEKALDKVSPQPRPFGGVTDLALFDEFLNPGERSAIFKLQSSSAAKYEGRKALHFFYLNIGTERKSAIARVEIPGWVAENPIALQVLQSVLVEQSVQAGAKPYPYPLIRAHEIAVVKMDDRDQVIRMIQTELSRLGFTPGTSSNKQSNKGLQERTRHK